MHEAKVHVVYLPNDLKSLILLFKCKGKNPSSQWCRSWGSSVSLGALIVKISASLKAKITARHDKENHEDKLGSTRRVLSIATYNPLVTVVSAAVCCSQSGRALFSIPRRQALLGGAADWDGVDAVCVAVTVTVIALATSITWCPDKDRAFPIATLHKAQHREKENTGLSDSDNLLLLRI